MTAPGLLAAFFDLDGTLMDREPLMEQAILATCRARGVEVELDAVGSLVGRAWQDVHRVLGIEHALGLDVEDFLADVLGEADRLTAGGFPTRVLEGGRALVERLHSTGVAVLLVTGSLRVEAELAIDHLAIAPFLTGSLAAEDFMPGNPRVGATSSHEPAGKPSPYPYLRALDLAGFTERDAANCVVFEDSEVGVTSGLAAGMKVVATAAANRPVGHPSHQDVSQAHAVVPGLLDVSDDLLAAVLARR